MSVDAVTAADARAPVPGDAGASVDAPLAADDVAIEVLVAADKLSASLTLTPIGSGRAVLADELMAALHAAGVVHGIDDQAVMAAAAAGRAEAMLVAEGQTPKTGDDARFEALVPDIKSRRPTLDDKATVDFRDLGLFVSVKAGEPLMRRIPASAGAAGRNVLGEVLPAMAGNDLPFAAKLDGAVIDPQDRDRLLAALTGQPVLVPCGVSVEPVLTVAAVDMSTGHIDFEGSVHVTGDVHSGMKIRAHGDVTVGGVVEAAAIDAGGSVTVKGGVIGHSEWAVGSARETAHIVAAGDVHTRFAEHAIVESGSFIQIEDAARQSLLCAMHKVVVGKPDGHSGHVIGGLVMATMLVQAGSFGSSANTPTRVEVGVNPVITRKLQALGEQLQQLQKEQHDLARVLAYAEANPQRLPKDMVAKAGVTAVHVEQQLSACQEDLCVLQAQLGIAAGASIVVGQRLYGGVTVKLGDLARMFDEERGAGTLRRVDEAISFD